MPITYTPLRFPGGKSKIYPFVSSLLSANGLVGCTYSEAFCGGAGLAVKLLLKGEVSRIVLNDFDPAVYSVWDAIIRYPQEMCSFVSSVELTVDEWRKQRCIYQEQTRPSLELGKAAFYLNRTNRSGILGGGIIGGLSQTGTYKMDARFNREGLCKKIQGIAQRSNDIELHNLDVMDFMSDVAPKLGAGSFHYFDPPYVKKGPGLYEKSFTDEDHRRLFEKLREYRGNWMVTYDSDELIEGLYTPSDDWGITVDYLSVGYSDATRRETVNERLVLGPGMNMPRRNAA